MDAEIKRKWVEALRSGKYLQCSGDFEREGSFCCLGVLCAVSGKPTTTGGIGNWAFVNALLPATGPCSPSKLAEKNDFGAPFTEIADLIDGAL
jgi:hypothetical protein